MCENLQTEQREVNGVKKQKSAPDKWQRLLKKYYRRKNVNQLIFVKYTGGSDAELSMYQKAKAGWKRILVCPCFVGRDGIGKCREGDARTPTGTFALIRAFGIKENPGAAMGYIRIHKHLYWCGDTHCYNRLIDIRKKPHDCKGEHMIAYAPQYNYGMVLDYNKRCVYPKGSAIFLHCTGSRKYTEGCVAADEKNIRKILCCAQKGAKICIYEK